MTRTTRRTTVLAAVLAFAAIAVLLFFHGCESTVETNGPVVLVEGDAVEPISPGVMVPLDLRSTNPQDVELSITNPGVVVHEIAAAGTPGTR